jgi:putative peptidoglycan lipid II flippase
MAPTPAPDEEVRVEPRQPGDPSVEAEQAGAALATAAAAGNTAATPAIGSRRRILTSASIIMVGQLLSSLLGMARIETLNVLFYGAASGAFVVALRPVQQLNDLLVGGSVSGALIPTFVDYSERERRDELSRIYSTVINLVLLAMAGAIVVLLVAAPVLVPFLAGDKRLSPDELALIISLVRIAAFSLVGLGLFAATSALLYALKDVVFPAFATGLYHIGVVACGTIALLIIASQMHLPFGDIFQPDTTPAIAEAHVRGASGLAVGAAVGALAEFAILIPGLRRAGIVWRPVLALRHPAVRQMLLLYLPIAAGLLISVGQQNLDVALQLRTPGGALANATALQSATTLVQFPTGLVVAALSFAVLPSLTAAASADATDDFKRILALGFRLGLLLMVPAMIGLIVLRTEIVALLFQHGTCAHACTVRNALALQNYAYQLPFLALDQLLIAAFYARKNTIVPVTVGVASILFYAAIAVPLSGTIGMPAIAFANAALNSSHAIILFILLTRTIGNLGMRDLAGSLGRILLAGAAMGLVIWLLLQVLPGQFNADTLTGQVLGLVVAGGIGSILYFWLIHLLGIEEVRMLSGIIRARLGRSRP